MLTRIQLVVKDFNEGISLEQPTTGQGDKRFNVIFSKVTKQWSAKPIKERRISGICIKWWKKLLNQLQKMKSFTTLLFLNCQKISLESQKPIRLLLFKTKNQDLQSEFSFFNCIFFLHLSKSSTKKKKIICIIFKNYKINLAFLPNTWHSSHQLLNKVLLFSIRHTKEWLSCFLFPTSWIPTK